jgi:hypothetical protein
MLRKVRVGFGMVVALALVAGDTRAQFGYGWYPRGYGGYGWGGWDGGSTVQGDIARGLGYFNIGAGVYNELTAEANAINADTVGRWNQYMFLSQQEANRREYLRMARRERRDATSGDLLYQRLRDNPNERDIRDGDALNVILDQLTDPRVHSSALRLATDPIGSDVVRAIPFEHASEAVTISLSQLAGQDGWPFALRGRDFDEERKAYQDAVARALKEDEEGDIKPETIQDVRHAIARIHAKFEAAPPKDRVERADAENYIRTLYGMARMLESPQMEQVIAELEKVPKTTLGSLLGFMHTFNLRFGPATTPNQEAVYRQLYPLMAARRDKILKPAGTEETPATARDGRPTDFFQGMHLDQLSGRKKPPAPESEPK